MKGMLVETADGSDQVTGCAFCNLNLQWDGYRSKTVKQVAADMDYLTDRHQTLSVALMDNVLPTKNAHKGTTVIQNLEIMKNCEALGIRNISNLILQFPGSDEDDVAATLQAFEFVLPLYPLKAVRFWLGLESSVWRNPKTYGIKAVFNHPNWSYLFPDKIFRSLPVLIQTYRGDLTYQKKIWKPVRKKVSDWQQWLIKSSCLPKKIDI